MFEVEEVSLPAAGLTRVSSHFFMQLSTSEAKPAKGIEPPTSGLQNRCSTIELRRPISYQRRGPGAPLRPGGCQSCMTEIRFQIFRLAR